MKQHTTGEKKTSYTPKDNLFSFFSRPINAKNPTPTKATNLKEVYDLIISPVYRDNTAKARTLDGKEYKNFKATNFDYVTFNGLFSYRNDKSLINGSQLFIIDLDHLGHKLTATFDRLKNDKVLAPQLIFNSPSGDGLKVVVKIDFTIIDTSATRCIMDIIWQPINTYFSIEYRDLIKPNEKNHFIDGAGKDLSRACFLCHHATAYLNINGDRVLGKEFLSDYPSVEVKTFKQGNRKKQESSKVSPKTSLQDLAARHLMSTDNHHPELLAFIGAAKAIGTPIEHTLNFISGHVHISPQSSCCDPNIVRKLVEDVYNRYNTDSEGVKFITELSFGYYILYFKYSGALKRFIPTSLFMDEVRNVLHEAGFAKRKLGKDFVYIQQKGCIISEVSPEIMRDYMTKYVTTIEESVCFTYQGQHYQIPPVTIREIYLKNSNNIFNDTWLEHLEVNGEPILKDSEAEMYFFFQNVIVTIGKEEIKIETWDEKSGFCVWADQISKHDFEHTEDFTSCHFYKFLVNVTNNDDLRFLTMVTGIGYLMHYIFRESEGQAVIFYDETITDAKTPQGGSGKGLIVNAIKQIRNVTKIDGKHFDPGNRFRWEQILPSTQVVWLDDAKSDFDFSTLHSNLTDGWTVERKFLHQFLIQPKDSPKTVISSNSIIKGGGSTNRRRQFVIELSDYYSKQIIRGDEKPIEDTHGCVFFSDDWNSIEWNKFFSTMIFCASQYMNYGLVFSPGINVEKNRFRQASNEDFAVWVEDQKFETYKRYETTIYYNSFVPVYYGSTHQIGQRTFTGWLKEYAAYKEWTLDVTSSNGSQYFQFKKKLLSC